MIKANEIRLGCWFNNKIIDKPVQMNEIILDSLLSVRDYESYEPIPLSPEILEKCGGEKDDKSRFGGYLFRLNGGEQIRIVYSDTIGWHWPMFGHTAVLVNYLHQFQNLMFSLDGEELEVKL